MSRPKDRMEFLFLFSFSKFRADFRKGCPNLRWWTAETSQRKSRIVVLARANVPPENRESWMGDAFLRKREVSRALRSRRGWCGLVSLNLPAPRTTPRCHTSVPHPRKHPRASMNVPTPRTFAVRSGALATWGSAVDAEFRVRGRRRRRREEGAKGVTGPGWVEAMHSPRRAIYRSPFL